MDWISIAFWVIIGLRILVGFWKGGLKTLVMLIIFAAGVGLAFALCKPVGGWIGDLGARNWLSDAVFGRIKDIEIMSFSGFNVTLGSEIDHVQLETAHAAWVAQGNTGTVNDMLTEALHMGYSKAFVPTVAYGTLDNLIIGSIPETGTFSLALLVANAVAQVVCIIIGFIGVVLAVVIVGFVIVTIIGAVRRASGHRPGIVSRLIGVVIGLATAFVTCWTIAIVLQSFATSFTPLNDFLVSSMRLDDPSYWNIGKFFFQIKFGYADLFNWLLSWLQPAKA